MFQTKHKKNSQSTETQIPKSIKYLGDIFCLPEQNAGIMGNIQIPRGSRRSALASKTSGEKSANRMRQEITSVFKKPFGLR